MDVRGLIPSFFVEDRKPTVRFYEVVGGNFLWDDDLPNIVTINLGTAKCRFVEGSNPSGLVYLAYQCDNANA
jgi:hypothetical protein